MHTPFFPISQPKEYMNRQELLLTEYGIYWDHNRPIWEFMDLSNRAAVRRKERIKAAEENKIFIG